MRIEIDQSIKIENTNKPTVLAFSNSRNGAIVILSSEKKLIQKYFRKMNEPRLFAYLSFAVLVFLLIKKDIKNRDQLVIDREYPSFETLIKGKIKEFISENTKVKDIDIFVSQIGKKSKAHLIAYSSIRKRSYKNIRKIFAREVIRIIRKNKKSGST